MEPQIFIIGAGTIGKALAAFLKDAGKEVVLIRGRDDNSPSITEHIEVRVKENQIIQADVPVTSFHHHTSLDGYIVVAAKSYGNIEISKKLKGLVIGSPIIILQNGLNVESPYIEAGFRDIFRCVLFATSQYSGENTLSFKMASASPIGIITGNDKRLEQTCGELSTPHFVFEKEQNIQPVIWTKTIINCVFNSICPLLETDNGVFSRNDRVLSLATRIVNECIEVAHLAGIVLNAEHVINKLLLISRSSDGQLISTYQDILQKRKTEIDTLNLEVAQIADAAGKSELVKQTRLLGELIKIKSEPERISA